jgi:DNA repair protein RadD
MISLRDYQLECAEALLASKAKRRLAVVPTGGGKSLIIAKICENESMLGRGLILTHVKELVEQNAAQLHRLNPDLDIGICCAGLGRFEHDRNITVASVQSVYKKLDLWEDINYIIIDEVHRITPVGGKLYRAIMERFPDVPVIGLTATPFRMGTGYLHKGEHAIFDEISYEVGYYELVERGFLVSPAQFGSDVAYDTSKLHVKMGEYVQKELDELVEAEKTRKIVAQFIERAKDRESWLIFAINVRHACMIRDMIQAAGISAAVLYDGMREEGLCRDTEISAFKFGLTRALVNVNILTTGFDYPSLDCVILCRPIASPVLFIQCVGRGTRTAVGKSDFLLLDYGGSCSRFGDFAAPEIREKMGSGSTKRCPSELCGEMNSQSARHCSACGFKFTEMFKGCPKCEGENDHSAQKCGHCGYAWPVKDDSLDEEASTIIPNTALWLDVQDTTYRVHKPRVTPERQDPQNCFVAMHKTVDGGTLQEYVFPDNYSSRSRFDKWWSLHHGKAPSPLDSIEAKQRCRELTLPRRIKVIRQGKFFNFLSRSF